MQSKLPQLAVLVVALVLAAGAGACGSSDKPKLAPGQRAMPDLVGKNWDNATDQLTNLDIPFITQAGPGTHMTAPFTGELEVCQTTPEAGKPVPTDVTLIVAPLGKC